MLDFLKLWLVLVVVCIVGFVMLVGMALFHEMLPLWGQMIMDFLVASFFGTLIIGINDR